MDSHLQLQNKSHPKLLWVVLILSIIVVGSGVFYWFQWRPANIRALCQSEVDKESQRLFDRNYQHQANGSIVSKEETWRTFRVSDGKILQDAAQEKYAPCLRRHKL